MEASGSLLENDAGEADNAEYSTDNSETELKTPDGGWGWVVCFACFMEGFLFDGIFFTVGIVFLELIHHFDSDKESVAWISSVNFGICMISGPLISALCNKFGFRAVTLAGTLLTSLGLVMSSFATSLQFLYFSYGLVAGVWYGMVYVPSIIAVTLYFNKRRAFATGLAMCGNGLGVFVMSPITDLLLRHYTWSGTFLIQAGLLLNGILCGLVYRPLVTESTPKNPHRKKGENFSRNSSLYSKVDKVHGETNTCAKVKEILDDVRCDLQKPSEHGEMEEITYRIDHKTVNKTKPLNKTVGSSFVDYIKDVKDSIIQVIIETFDMSLLKQTPFCIYTVSCTVYSLSYYVPYIYIPDVAKHADIDPSRGAWLLSSIGVINIISRGLLGVMSDSPGINRLVLYSVAVFVCGLVVIIMPFFESFGILLCICLLFGLFQVVIADLLGTKDTCQGLGILNLFSGIATFVGPPFAGWMYDVTAGFHVTFYVCGAIISISGAMLFIHPCLKRTNQTKT